MLDRIMGVITLKAPVYKQIAEDESATMTAAMIVVIAELINGFFSGLVKVDATSGAVSVNFVGAVLTAIVTVILGLIAWVVAAWILSLVAGMLGGKTNTGEMLRVTGFVEVFSLIGVLAVLALISPALLCVVAPLSLVAGILRLIGYLIGVREAAEFTTGKAIVTAIIAAIVNFIIVAIIGGVVLGMVAVAGAVAGG